MRLLLVRHAGTAVTRRGVVPDDEPAVAALADFLPWLGRAGTVITSPARRCLQPDAEVETGLRPWDLGAWTGREFAELDQDDLLAWRHDPTFDRHGGESLIALHARVSGLLEHWHARDGRMVAVTHAAVIKAAVACALQSPVVAAWDVDIHPGSWTELHATPTGWRVVRTNDRSQN